MGMGKENTYGFEHVIQFWCGVSPLRDSIAEPKETL